MSTSFKNKFEELNMTQDEINRFTEAMKKEEFRKLLIEYAEEISDPKNRELYEQEITKLEEERGMNVTFIHPEPGYCVKTTQDGNKKCYINICKNENIEKPSSKRDINNNKGGLYWQIPHSCSPAREDMEKSNKETCVVYDVVFHPDAYRMGETNQRFNQLLKDSAMDTIEKNYNVKLDKVNVKVLKSINFKGKPTASVIRKQKNNVENKKTNSSDDPIEKIVDQLKTNYLDSQREKQHQSIKTESKLIENKEAIADKYTKPVHKIIYRGKADMQDFANQLDSTVVQSTRPKEVFISIDLPLCKSSSDLILDIFEKRLYLESNNPFYKLDINLSYPVNEKEAKAKFDKSKRCLNVTLPVIPFSDKIQIHSDCKIENEQLEYSSSSPESSLSSSPIEQNLKDVVQDIKYQLPKKITIKELNDSIVIQISIDNYDKNSIKFNLLDKFSLVLSCESISASGTYLTYYKAYLNFFYKSVKYDLVESGSENEFNNRTKLIYLEENTFEIVLYKRSNNTESNLQVLIASQFMNQIETSNQECILINVSKDIQSDYEINKQYIKQKNDTNKMNKKDYIVNFEKISKQKDSDDDDDDDDIVKNFDENHNEEDNEEEEEDQREISENPLYSGSSSSSNDFSNENSSSLSSSMNSSMLKGILKKPRSISEGEGSLRGSFESNSCEGSNHELCQTKKCVSFNKQVVRNVFKPGSTITGMKKPNSNKNKKKNQKRNRTISDPSHNGDQDLLEHQVQFRLRSFSESSEDNPILTDSNENVDSFDSQNANNENNSSKKNPNKKKKKKNNKNKTEPNNLEKNNETFNMEKMIQMKSQGVLPSEESSEHKTSCAFKFKNKIADDLD